MNTNTNLEEPKFYFNSNLKKVTRFSAFQLEKLDEYYNEHAHRKLWPKERTQESQRIAATTGLSERQVKIYCRNKKAREVRMRKEAKEKILQLSSLKIKGKDLASLEGEKQPSLYESEKSLSLPNTHADGTQFEHLNAKDDESPKTSTKNSRKEGKTSMDCTFSQREENFEESSEKKEESLEEEISLKTTNEPKSINTNKLGVETQSEHKGFKKISTNNDELKKIERYLNSKFPIIENKTRFKWTQELHDIFVEAVKSLYNKNDSTPQKILKLMKSEVKKRGVTSNIDIKDLNRHHIASHLQKFRLKERQSYLEYQCTKTAAVAQAMLDSHDSKYKTAPGMLHSNNGLDLGLMNEQAHASQQFQNLSNPLQAFFSVDQLQKNLPLPPNLSAPFPKTEESQHFQSINKQEFNCQQDFLPSISASFQQQLINQQVKKEVQTTHINYAPSLFNEGKLILPNSEMFTQDFAYQSGFCNSSQQVNAQRLQLPKGVQSEYLSTQPDPTLLLAMPQQLCNSKSNHQFLFNAASPFC